MTILLPAIAGWLLSSFFLKSAAGLPAILLPALTNTVVSIVLKVVGSSGADAVRYLAASALKSGASLLPKIFGTAGMQASGWAFLMSWAVPIVAASAIIISAMRNKLALAEMLYVFGDIQNTTTGRFQLAQAHMYDTNQIEILEQFKTSSKRMLANSKLPLERIIGVGLTKKRKYGATYDLTDPNNPIPISGKEAIELAIGPDKLAKMASGNFFFDWS